MNSPKCSSDKKVKSGFTKGRQRYKCKDCGYNFTVEMKSTAKPASMKKQAPHPYLEGLGFRSTGRFFKVSNVSVLNWTGSFGLQEKELHLQADEIKIVEIDEMHTYTAQKKLLLDMDCC